MHSAVYLEETTTNDMAASRPRVAPQNFPTRTLLHALRSLRCFRVICTNLECFTWYSTLGALMFRPQLKTRERGSIVPVKGDIARYAYQNDGSHVFGSQRYRVHDKRPRAD